MEEKTTTYEELKEKEEREARRQEAARKGRKKVLLLSFSIVAVIVVGILASIPYSSMSKWELAYYKMLVHSSVEEFERYYENGDVDEVHYNCAGNNSYEVRYTFTNTDFVGYFEIPAYNPENLNEKNTLIDEYSITKSKPCWYLLCIMIVSGMSFFALMPCLVVTADTLHNIKMGYIWW